MAFTLLQTALSLLLLIQNDPSISADFREQALVIVEQAISTATQEIQASMGSTAVVPTPTANSTTNQVMSVRYVQSPAQDRNELTPGERATVYGTGLNIGNVYVRMIGKAEDQQMTIRNVYAGSADFTIPDVDAGEYDLFLERLGVVSNKIKVSVLETVPAVSVEYAQSPAGDPNILNPGERATVYGRNLDTDGLYVRMIGKAEDQQMTIRNVYAGSADFTIPDVDAGQYDLFVEWPDGTSNKIKVTVL